MRRGFSPWRDLPALVWLAAIPVVAFSHPWIPEPRWLVLHLLLLGAVTHSIVVWSQQFADALLHVPSTPRPRLLALLNLGATLGVLLARGLPDPWHARILLAHVAVNLLGWVGLTVAGTVVTLWPTMLRTRLGAGSDAALRRALPVLLVGVLGTVGACLLGAWPLAAVGVTTYVVGVLLLGAPLLEAARRKPPSSHPAWSLGAGLVWLVCCLVAWAVIL